jgi:imidazoleglycerol phosphate synthase glutamine amidotransferase subunit HisH
VRGCFTQNEANKEFVLSTTNYGDDFISSIRKGEIYATQFHPEKSGAVGEEAAACSAHLQFILCDIE